MNALRNAPLLDDLTGRELEILALIADGASNAEIADRLILAVGTVKWYNNQIYDKLGARNRTQAIARARELGLLDGGSGAATSPARPAAPHQLPAQPTPFVGRQAELAMLHALLADPANRLITLIGPGGIGKTRLALEAAREQVERFPGGVGFVALAPLAHADDIVATIAQALDFHFQEGASLRAQLLDFLARQRLLLVLDNFDNLLAGSELVLDMLHAAPDLTILVTSRERLNLQEEVLVRIEGLPVPDPARGDDLRANDAVRLFEQSARRIRPDFEIDADTLDAVVRICRLVEGMPLGIVLAAAWVPVLAPAEIAAEIHQGLDFLATTVRDIPARHRSVRAVFDSTWNMLAPEEQAVFARLSVFRGGFTRDAAQNVAAANLANLMVLSNKSLLVHCAEDGRYEIHELLRQYAQEQLDASGAASATYAAHSHYFLDAIRQREPELAVHTPSGALEGIASDFDNMRAAWDWAAEQGDYALLESALRGLHLFCAKRGRYHDMLFCVDRALALADRAPGAIAPLILLRLRECRGRVRGALGDFDGAVSDLDAVCDAAQQRADQAWERELRVALGQLFRKMERPAEAVRHLNTALNAARRTGDLHVVADTLYHFGTVAWDEGDNAQALALHQEAADLCDTLDLCDLVAVQAYHGLGEALLASGQPQRAIDNFTRSLDYAREVGDLGYQAENLQMIGWASVGNVGLGDYHRARDAFAQSLAIAETAHLEWHRICSLTGLGLAQGSLGDYRQGLATAYRGYEAAGSVGLARFLTLAVDSLGQLYQDLHLLEKAGLYHDEGVRHMLRSESTWWLPRVLANRAIDRLRQGHLDGEEDLQSAFEIATQRDQGFHAARCLEGLAELAIARGDPDAALRYADQLLAFAEPRNRREAVAQAHRWRGEALLLAGQVDEAELHLARALERAIPVGRVRLTADLHDALARLHRRRGDAQAAARHARAAQDILAAIRANLADETLAAGLDALYPVVPA